MNWCKMRHSVVAALLAIFERSLGLRLSLSVCPHTRQAAAVATASRSSHNNNKTTTTDLNTRREAVGTQRQRRRAQRRQRRQRLVQHGERTDPLSWRWLRVSPQCNADHIRIHRLTRADAEATTANSNGGGRGGAAVARDRGAPTRSRRRAQTTGAGEDATRATGQGVRPRVENGRRKGGGGVGQR